MKVRFSLIAVLVGSLLLVGCGAKQTNKAKTAKEALENYQTAISKKDKAFFMSCLSVPEAQKEQAEAWFDLATAMFELQDSMKKTYGDASLRASNLKSEFPADKQWLEQIDIKEDGAKATVTDKSKVSKEPLTLVKEGEVWKIKIDLPWDKSKMESVTKVIKDAIKNKSGKAGYTPEKIEQEIGAELAGKTPSNQPATGATTAPEKS